MIKYLGSKRRLVPALEAVCAAVEARTALDLFTGTTRVAQAFKRCGATVTAVDSARYAHVLARCYIETDAQAVDDAALSDALATLNALPGRDGYATQVFSTEARYFQANNARRIDAIRAAIASRWPGSPLEPLLLTSLIEAADRVDSTTGVQMAYVKQWAPRSFQDLELRRPALIDGTGHAVFSDACDAARTGGPFDLAYLDPPYNQHRYTANYHVWETLIAGDEPQHYGVACKRIDLRDPANGSRFNRKREMPEALRACVVDVDAEVVVVSCSNEGWVGIDDLRDWCAPRGHVEVVAFPSRRYVGAQIGVYNPKGERVGETSHVHNLEYLVMAGPKRRARTLRDIARTIEGSCSP